MRIFLKKLVKLDVVLISCVSNIFQKFDQFEFGLRVNQIL